MVIFIEKVLVLLLIGGIILLISMGMSIFYGFKFVSINDKIKNEEKSSDMKEEYNKIKNNLIIWSIILLVVTVILFYFEYKMLGISVLELRPVVL